MLVVLVSSCKKDDDDECPACPKISSISPTHGRSGDTIVISGSKFSSSYLENTVKFNGKAVDVSEMISGNESELRVKVPSKCGTGPVTVFLDADLYSEPGPVFTYEATVSVSVYAGTPGVPGDSPDGTTFADALLNGPTQIAFDNNNNLFVLDFGNQKVRKMNATSGLATTLLSSNPYDCIATDANNVLYVSTYNAFDLNSEVFKFTPGASSATFHFTDFDDYRRHVSITCDSPGDMFIARHITNLSDPYYDVVRHTTGGTDDFVSSGGDVLYYRDGYLYQLKTVVGSMFFDSRLSRISVADTTETVLIDFGEGLYGPKGIVVTSTGKVYVADTGNNRIITYQVGTPGYTEFLSGLDNPQGMAMDNSGAIYFAETGTHCIKKIIVE